MKRVNAAYDATFPHGFFHTHDLLPPLTAIEVESQDETRRIHALMMGQQRFAHSHT
jgi:hypothetical protein